MKPETVYNKLELEMICQVKLSMLELCLKNESKNIDPLFIDRYKKEFLENCDKLNTLDLPIYTKLINEYAAIISQYEKK